MKEQDVDRLDRALKLNSAITAILDRVPPLKMKNWYLGAGCISQTVWNEMHGFPPGAHIKDYDLIYFDESDLSYEAEDSNIKAAGEAFRDLGVAVEVKNEARVHLWYENHFGYPIQPYRSSEDAIASWPTTATCVGVRRDDEGRFMVYAPFGLQDLFDMIVRPNKRQTTKEVYLEKANRWASLWPDLSVILWEEVP